LVKSSWSELCKLRKEILSKKEFTVAEFAADLNGVRTGVTPNIYKDAELFFSRTYPTPTLKKLVKDIFIRLLGEGGTPVRHIQVTYGGGKTHTLIILLHLAEKGAELQKHPIVKEFLNYANIEAVPKARVAILPLDKFDVINGLEVFSPTGRKRRVKTLWGALAYQLGGDESFLKIKEHEDTFTPPAEPELVEILKTPQKKEGLSTLILIDEVLIYYRGLVNKDHRRLGTLKDFFQYLTQAVTKVENCALVASLISSVIEKKDVTGLEILEVLTGIFQRVGEVEEPVKKDDISELLRRRLFEDLPSLEKRRELVDQLFSKAQAIPQLKDSQKDQKNYDRFLKDYPFHPSLIDIFYQKWTQLDDFQRTRGALRLFAYALRESTDFDQSLIIGPSVFLQKEKQLSDAVIELVSVCDEKDKWPQILQGELQRGLELYDRHPSLKNNEIEQAIISVFLHSQPRGQKAETSDLFELILHPKLDVTAMDAALTEWRNSSWFLKDVTTYWMLTTKPNITNLHLQAINRIKPDKIIDELNSRIRKIKAFRKYDKSVTLHLLPKGPSDVPDKKEIHYLILDHQNAINFDTSEIPETIEEYFTRVYKNHIIALVPEKSKLNNLKYIIRDYLGWENLENSEEFKLLEDYQKKELKRRKKECEKTISDVLTNLYEILVTLDENGKISLKKLPHSKEIPFEKVKTTLVNEDRLLVKTLDLPLLLPGSFYKLWREGEKRKKISDLISAFAQFPRLPKILSSQTILDTIKNAILEGNLVLEIQRPDGTKIQYWKTEATIEHLTKPEAEIILLEDAKLEKIESNLLKPGELPDLWGPDGNDPVKISELLDYFNKKDLPKLKSPSVLHESLVKCIEIGDLMLIEKNQAYLKEKITKEILFANSVLITPVRKIVGKELGQDNLPNLWVNEKVSFNSIWDEISKKFGYKIPWIRIRDAINDALNYGLFVLSSSSSQWPCSKEQIENVEFQLFKPKPTESKPSEPPVVPTIDWDMIIQDFFLTKWDKTPIPITKLREDLENSSNQKIPISTLINSINSLIHKKIVATQSGLTKLQINENSVFEIVTLPKIGLFAESLLSTKEIQDLGERLVELLSKAPELDFDFRIIISVEGIEIDDNKIKELNSILKGINPNFEFRKTS